jgi:tellurium resistance protein TerZ
VDATTGAELARYDLTGAGSHTGQVMAQMTKTGGGWDMKALGVRTNGQTFHDMMDQITASL